MIIIQDQADLEISREQFEEIRDRALIEPEAVWPRFQLRPGRPCLALRGDRRVLSRFLIAAGSVLDPDHAEDLFERSEDLWLRPGVQFQVFPDVLLADQEGPDYEPPVEG